MDKYKSKNTFQQCFSPILLENLSDKAQKADKQFNRYSKKFNFDAFLKLFIFDINGEPESLQHIYASLLSPELQAAVDLDSINYSQLYRRLAQVHSYSKRSFHNYCFK